MKSTKKEFLVFGGTGSIGSECIKSLGSHGKVHQLPKDELELGGQLAGLPPLDGVLWAQGLNLNDSITDVDIDSFQRIMEANVLFILKTANILTKLKKLKNGCQLVVIGSMWAHLSRPSKLSYSTSKAACLAVVRSLAVDLGPYGIQANSISPGPIDSPMTRRSLIQEQLERIIAETPLNRLITMNEVTSIIVEFMQGSMSGITGQDILIDAGWSVSKLV